MHFERCELPFVDDLCISWPKEGKGRFPESKKALIQNQDPFTRTLYENEKITFRLFILLKYVQDPDGQKHCCEPSNSCGDP